MTPRRVGTVALLVALGLGPVLSGAGWAHASGDAAAAAPAPNVPLVTGSFEDNFDGPRDAPPDGSLWTARTRKPLFNHQNLATYTSDPANLSLDGHGHLRITARRDDSSGTPTYTSAVITSKQLVGPDMHIEARVKMAGGYGLWPNFWIQGVNSDGLGWPATGEIDIAEEASKLPTKLWATAHGLDVPGDDYLAHWKSTTILTSGVPLAARYHVYALDVTPDSLTWSADGYVYKTLYRNQLKSGQEWSFDNPFVVIFSLAVGGPFPSDPKPSTKFPTSMKIDYVKVTPA